MMVGKLAYIVLPFLALLAVGCSRNAPVYNINDAMYPYGELSNSQMKRVEKAMLEAGSSLGWVMKPVRSGHIVGTVTRRGHSAVIDISYNRKGYSIIYKDSYDLKYDGLNIHKVYNKWIVNLDRQFRARLAVLLAG